MKRVTKFLLQFGIAITFMAGTFVFGEFHPFSHFYMYNNFPNWSYVFYFVDGDRNLIPANQLNTDGIKLGYLYYTIAEKEHIPYGNGIESNAQLKIIGQKMVEEVLLLNQSQNHSKNLKLVRTYYFFQNNHIQLQSTIMYEKGPEK